MKEEALHKLFQDFPEISTQAWEEKIRADLKGADYERKLIWKSDEGIAVKPFYRSEDTDALSYLDKVGSLRQEGTAPNSWTICQDIIPGKNLQETNERAIAALKGGAQALRIQLSGERNTSKSMLAEILKGISLDETEILFQGFLGADLLIEYLGELSTSGGINKANLKGCLGADPYGKMASTGIPYLSSGSLSKLVRSCRKDSPDLRVIDVNGGLFQEAGSTLVQELACTLSMGNAYLAQLTHEGIEAGDVVRTMQFSMSSGSNYFMEIAKLRALRILWAAICREYGVEAEDARIRIHSTSSKWNMTLYDPQVNMLRGTTEAMSSILGGADLLSVLPYDHAYAPSSVFTDRIARNVQIILRDEAYLERVADPSSGSYYIENLTDAMAEKAWSLFREIETEGGFREALGKGTIQKAIEESRRKKIERLASGRDHLLGTNAFPNFNEFMLKKAAAIQPEQLDDTPMKAIRPFRLSAGFEALRLQTEASGKRPRVFLLKHGNPAWVTARASFSGNFFACAGYEIIDQAAASSVGSAIDAAKESQAELVVLCSSDDAYVSMAHEVRKALDTKQTIVIAGYPKDQIEEIRQAGVEHFIHMKSNVLETLQSFNAQLLN